jgi:hypothetical protein
MVRWYSNANWSGIVQKILVFLENAFFRDLVSAFDAVYNLGDTHVYDYAGEGQCVLLVDPELGADQVGHLFEGPEDRFVEVFMNPEG